MPEAPWASHGPGAGLVTLPNIITFGRLCAVPLAVWLVLQHHMSAAFFLFVAAGLSDAVDGWLARRGAASALGAMLDPAADKALLVTMFVTLAAVDALPDWLAILVVFRDVVIVGGLLVLFLLGHPATSRPLGISKLNTALQIGLIALTLGLAAFGLAAPWLLTVSIWIVAASTFGSGAAYVWRVARRA
jgi:cardiolipin synthase